MTKPIEVESIIITCKTEDGKKKNVDMEFNHEVLMMLNNLKKIISCSISDDGKYVHFTTKGNTNSFIVNNKPL